MSQEQHFRELNEYYIFLFEMAMQSAKINRAELAKRLGTSRSYITQLFGGHYNFTFRQLARIMEALDPKDERGSLEKGEQM